jgi:hypothetical protein
MPIAGSKQFCNLWEHYTESVPQPSFSGKNYFCLTAERHDYCALLTILGLKARKLALAEPCSAKA